MFGFLLHLSPWFLVLSSFLSALAFFPGMFIGVAISFILYLIGVPASIGDPLGVFCMLLFGTLTSGFTFCLCLGLYGRIMGHFKG